MSPYLLVNKSGTVCCCKTKKKVAVTFAVPLDESVEQLPSSSSPGVTGGVVDEGEAALDGFDIVDEHTSLLQAEGGRVVHAKSSGDISGVYQTPDGDSHLHPLTAGDPRDAIGASNISLASLSTSDDDDVEWVDAAEDRALTAASQSSPSVPGTPRQKPGLVQTGESAVALAAPPPVTLLSSSVPTTTTSGDMYHWMKRQQDFTASRLRSQHPGGSGMLQSRPASLSQESWTFAGASDLSRDDSVDVNRQRYVTRSAFQLADAQVQF